jgi:hypothetical protein
MIRPEFLHRAATHTLGAALMDMVGIALWILALSGVLSPHPWVFMVLGLAACAFELGAIAMTVGGSSRNPRSRVLTICLLLGGALPPVLVLVLAIVPYLA